MLFATCTAHVGSLVRLFRFACARAWKLVVLILGIFICLLQTASVNINSIVRDLDIATLQNNLINITFCDVDAEDLRNVDVNFIKMFKLSQLMLEYVLFHQVRSVGAKRQIALLA